jgi:hypothetical protein
MLENASQQDMSLGHISDFNMRKKVAELMAVAPALPTSNLYGLLVDLEGDLPAARKQAFRASRAPSISPSIKSRRLSIMGPTRPCSRPTYDTDGDEVMVKVDPNDDFLGWVSAEVSRNMLDIC